MRIVVLVACMVLLALVLGGCRHTDALTEVLYTQDAEIIDYDNPTKVYVPVRNSDTKDENMPPQERDESDVDDEREQAIPDAAEANQSNNELPRPDVVAGPDTNYHEAGNAAVADARDTSPVGDNTAGQAPGTDEGGQGTSEGGSEGEGDPNQKDPSHDETQDPGGPAGPGMVYDARNGTLEELPQAERVVAAGDLAQVVVTIGGAQALAGAPETYAGDPNANIVFGPCAAAFAGDGMGAGSAYVDSIIALAPDAVLIPDGCQAIDDATAQALVDAGIDIALLPSMHSAGGIRSCANQVGQVLVGQPGQSGMAPRATADAYLEFYDRVMREALNSHGGTFAVSTFDAATGGEAGSGVVSLYIDGWEDVPVVVTSFPAGSILRNTQGVAFCTNAAAHGPVSTFMSAGGAVNNTLFWETQTWLDKAAMPVLHFNENFVSYRTDGPSVLSGGSGIRGGAFRVLTNAADGSGCLGQGVFPGVIARTQGIAAVLDYARSVPGTLYWPGQLLDQGVGEIVDGEFLPMFSLPGYGIYVNPAGYLGSWADDGMESVLESVWVASKFSGYPEGNVRALVSEYYRVFYGIGLGEADIDTILSGAFAG